MPKTVDNCRVFLETQLGQIILGDGLEALAKVQPKSVDLIMTSPPFGLVRKKGYGNVDADKYVKWFRPFGDAFRRILKDRGSLVIDIGGSWVPGQPTRSLYHFKLLLMLCEAFPSIAISRLVERGFVSEKERRA